MMRRGSNLVATSQHGLLLLVLQAVQCAVKGGGGVGGGEVDGGGVVEGGGGAGHAPGVVAVSLPEEGHHHALHGAGGAAKGRLQGHRAQGHLGG